MSEQKLSDLYLIGSCKQFTEWLQLLPKNTTLKEAWNTCPRGDWLMWLAQEVGINDIDLLKAAYKCMLLPLDTYNKNVAENDNKIQDSLGLLGNYLDGQITKDQLSINLSELGLPAWKNLKEKPSLHFHNLPYYVFDVQGFIETVMNFEANIHPLPLLDSVVYCADISLMNFSAGGYTKYVNAQTKSAQAVRSSIKFSDFKYLLKKYKEEEGPALFTRGKCPHRLEASLQEYR